jgi:acyl-CoA reductase-like NAD-dependent aldehyde dehydrogenase
MTPVTLELGGKDAFIVFDDCDYNHVCPCHSLTLPVVGSPLALRLACWVAQMLDVAIRGAFINCGTCAPPSCHCIRGGSTALILG